MQDQDVINVLKGLVIDAVHKANSGHPGGPMSSMDMTYLLYTEFLRFDPKDPRWMGRDRFVLSAGHMSMLQYAMLAGIGWLEIDDLKAFRQMHSKTPGHPENFMTPGVECTTGPLGQGAAMSVGFALSQQHCGAVLDKELFQRRTWAVVSDGDLQEGIAHDAAALAGHWKLDNLIWVYDSNRIQLSGPTSRCMSEDIGASLAAMGWRVLRCDGHDHAAVRKAYTEAVKPSGQPTIVIADTTIGKGCATMENTSKTHGSPLPAEEREKTKAKLGLPAGTDFHFPDAAVTQFRRNFGQRQSEADAWRKALNAKLEGDAAFRKSYLDRFEKRTFDDLPSPSWAGQKSVATRNAFGDTLAAWAPALPGLIGGSADLEPSVMTGAFAKAVGSFDATNRAGRGLEFGVREFAMAAICNGIALHGGLIPFDATFLSFADYSRPALRLGAIQRVRVIHEFTHDSFHLGEDGPTHQPVEHVMGLRLIPDLYVMRPADAHETELMMRKALELGWPSAHCLSRQKLPLLGLSKEVYANASRGAYVVKDAARPTLLLLATGSEVALALEVAAMLKEEQVKVVSMPCWELFAEQPRDYREQVLCWDVKRRVSLEAGVTIGWQRFVGDRGLTIGLDHYGASAPAETLAEAYGFTAAAVAKRIAQHAFT